MPEMFLLLSQVRSTNTIHERPGILIAISVYGVSRHRWL